MENSSNWWRYMECINHHKYVLQIPHTKMALWAQSDKPNTLNQLHSV